MTSKTRRTRAASSSDIAEHFGVCLSTIYNWCRVRGMPHERTDGRYRFDPAECDRWLRERGGRPMIGRPREGRAA